MAYNAENEVRTETLRTEKNRREECWITSKIEKDGSSKVDIRQYYTEEKSGELRPSKNGIRLTDELAAEVIVGMFKALSVEGQIDVMNELDNLVGGDEYDKADEEGE